MFIKPQLATLYEGFPPGRWIYEVKFDGYRMQANRQNGKSHFYTRSGLNWLSKFSFIHAGLNKLPPDIIVDGEVVSVESNGRTNFSQLQAEQFIIVGYVPASSGRGIGALRLANKDLTYAGKVGTGFSAKVSLALREQLDQISVPKAPIKMSRKKNTQWVEPKMIAKVAYRDITDDGLLRHASFKGLA